MRSVWVLVLIDEYGGEESVMAFANKQVALEARRDATKNDEHGNGYYVLELPIYEGDE